MTSTHQPLLNTPKNSTLTFKILAIFTILIISTIFLVQNLTQNDLTSPIHICHKASNPKFCESYVSEIVPLGTKPQAILPKFLMNQVHRMKTTLLESRKLRNDYLIARNQQGPLSDCLELLDISVDLVLNSIKALRNPTTTSHANAQAWLSGVLTNHETCLDELNELNFVSVESIILPLGDLILRAKASLGILSVVSNTNYDKETSHLIRGSLPSWVTPMDRKLLESNANTTIADITVAKDGSGSFKTIVEAIAAVPDKSKKRYVVYVKEGTYQENVIVGKSKKNVMLIGDGMNSTIITGDLNVIDGSTTFNSATLAAVGEGFILQDICIQNTAGPEKHQAVALRVGADKSVINRCRIDAYQDTLYTHSLRQFYKDTYVTGTVDFIFGNAAVVFQKCSLVPRKPMKSQKNMITAQGRTDPNQNTGISIQDCVIKASEDLEPVKSSFPTYLGRPWKEYSRTVVMQSDIGDVVDPTGWAIWSGDFALDTLYYGEYMNMGPGSGTSKRVNWTGYHVITDPNEALKFTVKELIQGEEWISNTGVAFTEGL